MAEQTTGASSSAGASPEDWTKIAAGIGERSQRLLNDFLTRTAKDPSKAMNLGMADAMSIGSAFMELTTRMWSNPQKLVEAQMSLWTDYMNLWRSTTMRMMGQAAE